MDDYVRDDVLGNRVNVAMELARLGAYVGQDGNVYELGGRRIEFFHHYEGGAVPPPGFIEDGLKHLEEMKKTSTVIETRRDPRLPLLP
jgi:hypothetical protein